MASTATGHGETQTTLRGHMAAMSYILDEVWAKAADPKDYPLAADKVRELRGHLAASIGYKPPKLETLPTTERRLAEIEYHQISARVIFLLGTLEQTLLKETVTQGPSRETAIRQLLSEISTAIGRGHGKFR
jgi:hypothetical protein